MGYIAQTHNALRRRRNKQIAQPAGIVPELLVEAKVDFVLFVALFELSIQYLSANQCSDIAGKRIDLHAEICGANTVHNDAQFLLRGFKIRLHVDDTRNRPEPVLQVGDVCLQLLEVRPHHRHE